MAQDRTYKPDLYSDYVPTHITDPAGRDNLLQLARFLEDKGERESALEIYEQTISKLNNNNPIRKEIQIVIRQLEEEYCV